MPFMCICNPVDVWDNDAYFASSPKHGYWVFPKAVFTKVAIGDRLFLRLTSKAKLAGIVGTFTVTRKTRREVENDHWREGKHPVGLQHVVEFSVDAYFPNKRVTVEDLKALPLSAKSRFVLVPQTTATEVQDTDALLVEGLVNRRLALLARKLDP